MPEVNIISYTSLQLKEWEDELKAVGLDISKSKDKNIWNEFLVRLDQHKMEFTSRSQREIVQQITKEHNDLQQKMGKLIQKQKWLQDHIDSANSFIKKVNENPQELVNELKGTLEKTIEDYKKQHFINRSLQVRRSLFMIENGLTWLIKNSWEPEVHCQNYLRLCGFLVDCYTQVQQENKDKDFLQTLADIINTIHINPQEDLSYSEFRIAGSAVSCYEAVKQKYGRIFNLSMHDLHVDEVMQFQKIKDSLLVPSLQPEIQQVIQFIDMELSEKISRNEYVDYYYYTNIAQTLMQLRSYPTNQEAAKHLFYLAEHATGNVSVTKQVLGGLLIAVGCMMIAASAGLFLSTMGSSSMLSIWGGTLGLNILQTQAAISTACSITTAIGTGLSFWGGRTFSAGMRQGLSQALVAAGNTSNEDDLESSYYLQA